MPPEFYLWLVYYASPGVGEVALFQSDEGQVAAETVRNL